MSEIYIASLIGKVVDPSTCKNAHIPARRLCYNSSKDEKLYVIEYVCQPGQLLVVESQGKLVNIVAGNLLAGSQQPSKIDLKVSLQPEQSLLLVGALTNTGGTANG